MKKAGFFLALTRKWRHATRVRVEINWREEETPGAAPSAEAAPRSLRLCGVMATFFIAQPQARPLLAVAQPVRVRVKGLSILEPNRDKAKDMVEANIELEVEQPIEEPVPPFQQRLVSGPGNADTVFGYAESDEPTEGPYPLTSSFPMITPTLDNLEHPLNCMLDGVDLVCGWNHSGGGEPQARLGTNEY